MSARDGHIANRPKVALAFAPRRKKKINDQINIFAKRAHKQSIDRIPQTFFLSPRSSLVPFEGGGGGTQKVR